MDGVYEKLNVANFAKYSKQLQVVVDSFVKNSVVTSHSEHDIQWGLLTFLLDCANNPVLGLKTRLLNDSKIFHEYVAPVEVGNETEESQLVRDLKENNWSGMNFFDDESDLSDWTETEDEDDDFDEMNAKLALTLKSPEKPPLPPKPVVIASKLEPPKRSLNYTKFDPTTAIDLLKSNVQSNWWTQAGGVQECKTYSKYPAASFCQIFNELLARTPQHYGKVEYVTTISEYNLLRETFWMFIRPTNMRFYHLYPDGRVGLAQGVSIPSVTRKGLGSFLANFTSKMSTMNLLRKFCHHVLRSTTNQPHTLEAYASELSLLLKKITEAVLEKEKQVMQQEPGVVNSILETYNHFLPLFQLLENLWDFHRSATMSFSSKHPNCLLAGYLLAGLRRRMVMATTNDKAALGFSLYIKSLRPYIELIDIWWAEGRLEDWLHEFIVAPREPDPLRPWRAYTSRLLSFESSHVVSDNKWRIIRHDTTIWLLTEHAVEAGETLSYLSQLDRMHELKKLIGKKDSRPLYHRFLERVTKELKRFQTVPSLSSLATSFGVNTTDAMKSSQYSTLMTESMMSSVSMDEIKDTNAKISEFKDELVDIGGDMLLKVFQVGFEEMEKSNEVEKPAPSLLVDEMKAISDIIPPYERVMAAALKDLLNENLVVAQQLLLKIFKEEFHLLIHFQNLRQVYLMEATSNMQCFYIPLFKDVSSGLKYTKTSSLTIPVSFQIEAGRSWTNPYLLTAQLSSAMSTCLTDYTSLFTVTIESEFSRNTTNVLEAVDELTINYVLDERLCRVITPLSLERYNKSKHSNSPLSRFHNLQPPLSISVFRFLLKVKWAVWTLDNLKFHVQYKRRFPYAPVTPIEMILRRLMLVRTWIFYLINCLHSHLIHFVITNLDQQLNTLIEKARNLSQIIKAHEGFVSTAFGDCFLKESDIAIQGHIRQLLRLVSVVRDEWKNLTVIMELEKCDDMGEFLLDSNMQELEETYIELHQKFASTLETAVYKKGRRHLAELHAAYSCSIPV